MYQVKLLLTETSLNANSKQYIICNVLAWQIELAAGTMSLMESQANA